MNCWLAKIRNQRLLNQAVNSICKFSTNRDLLVVFVSNHIYLQTLELDVLKEIRYNHYTNNTLAVLR